jgi:hypothetical protein
MIPDPLTLGITGNINVYSTRQNGPGASTVRGTSLDTDFDTITLQEQELKIAHETVAKTGRRRSVFRLEARYVNTVQLTAGTGQAGTAVAQVTLDLPGVDSPSGADRQVAALALLSRLLGFLSENATIAPDFDFSSNENVLRFVDGEP